jgi:hypothetical protein
MTQAPARRPQGRHNTKARTTRDDAHGLLLGEDQATTRLVGETVARTRFRFRDLSAASAMAVRSLGPPTAMSLRLAIGH